MIMRNLSPLEVVYLIVVLPATALVVKLFIDRLIVLRLQQAYGPPDKTYHLTAKILVASNLGAVVSLLFFSIIGILVALSPNQDSYSLRSLIITGVLFALVLIKCGSIFYV